MDSVRNLLLAGLGALSYSQEKLKTSINSLIEKGELSRDQGEKVIQEWVERGEDEQAGLSDRLSSELQRLLQKLALVHRDEFEELKSRVDRLDSSSPE